MLAASVIAPRTVLGLHGARPMPMRHRTISMDLDWMQMANSDAFNMVANSNGLRWLVAFAAAFRTGAAFAVIDQPRLPPAVGVHEHVGVTYARCGGARVKVFYPAAAASDQPAPYCTDGRKTSDGMAGLVGFKQLGLSFLLAHLASAPSGTWLNAPPATTAKGPPLLVYSHGRA